MLRRHRRHRSATGDAGPRRPPRGPATDDLDRCDGYMIIVTDPLTGAVDAYGPYPGSTVVLDAEQRRQEFDSEHLHDVTVDIVRRHRRR